MTLVDQPSSSTEPAALQPIDARQALARLRALHEAGRVRVAVDRRKLSHMDFPLSLEADSNQWAYAIVVVIGIVWWQFGIVPGVACAVAGFLVYQFVARPRVARRLERRIHTRGLAELDSWRKLWQFGGVILTDTATGETCQGPDGRWIGFIEAAERKPAP